ncbi:hypothetical protein T484DRAFT_2775258 [Baffinella frigidus]|nr:hypothetical protein T484DRAFT_2775258 [Cryptophyta sp. CCMP2293]
MHHASAAASEAALVADPKAWALPCIPAPPPPLPPPVVARGGCVCGGERARRLLEQEMAACERILQDELSVRDAHVRQLTAENRSIASALASALLSPAPPPPPARAQPPTALARAAAPGGVGHVAWAVEQQVGVGHAGSREGGGGSAACQSGAAVSSGGEKRDAHDAVEEAYAAPGLRPSLRHPRAGAAGANVASVGAWGWGGGQAAVAVGQEATPARPRIGAQPHAVGRGE